MSRKAFFFGLALVALLVISLYQAKYGAREAAAEIELLDAEIAEAVHEKSLLEAELAHMSRREWIEDYARNELGMGPAKAEQFARETDLDGLIGPPELRDEDGVPRTDREAPEG
ncbi:MAG: septum formation initiator family protein [Hyphomonadaceae bacterium]